MLNHSKTSIKTSLLILMFTALGTYLTANNFIASNNRFLLVKINADTVETVNSVQAEKLKQDNFVVPESLKNKRIDFQINSDISYLNFSHFVKPESKKLFIEAFQKENELLKLKSETDSLRKIYSNASGEKREEIAAGILNNEKRSIELNEEVPELYQNARNLEDQYWKSADPVLMAQFQQKIKLYSDSINKRNSNLETRQIASEKEVSDTITLFKAFVKNQEIKNETNSGVIYKIMIGAFKNKTPDSAAKLIKKLSIIRNVENYVDDKGVTIYTTGNLKSFEEANILQKQVKQEGARNPVIIAYMNGKKITVEAAKKINKEL